MSVTRLPVVRWRDSPWPDAKIETIRVDTPASRFEMAIEVKRVGVIGHYQLRKLLDGPVPFPLAMKLITKDFREAVRAAMRREQRRRRHA